MTGQEAERVRQVWDLPVRLCHWSMVLLFAAAWWTAENDLMYRHRQIGYLLSGVLLFRLYWGLAGSSNARFVHFFQAPRSMLRHARALLRGAPGGAPAGHNPLGGLSALVLLSLLLVQVGLGLFAVDVDGLEAGPLSYYLSFDAGRLAAELHETLFDVLLFFVTIHLAAIVIYRLVGGQRLLGRMVHGRGVARQPEGGLMFRSFWWWIPGLLLAALLVWYLNSLDLPL